MPRRALMLARQFPPIGGAGVQRSVGTVRHLPEFGWEPVVVTGPAQHVDRFNPQDPGLLGAIPQGTEVHRLPGPEPAARSGRRERIDRLLQIPAPWGRWWADGALAAGRAAAAAGGDVLLVSCNPYETALAGARLAAELGLPWIADLEDPWALDDMRVHPTALHRRRDLRQMRDALRTADAVIMCADEAAARVRRALPELRARIITSIPIGAEPEDFEVAPAAREPGVLRIVHTGTIHTEMGERHRETRRVRRLLGGSAIDVDVLTRSHLFLLQAVDRVLRADPALAGRIEVVLAGGLTPGDRAAIGERPWVRTPGLLPHAASVALLRSADLLFLPMYDLPPGQRARIVPYKTYEYLAAGAPILAAVPDGDARDMLAASGRAALVRPADVTGMADAVRAAAARIGDPHPAGRLAPELERRAAVKRIAAVLDAVAR